MNKGNILVLAAAMVSAIGFANSASAKPAYTGPLDEVGYKQGALGVAALTQGDYATAEAQLNRLDGVTENDPARLINLGSVYARTGRLQDAERAYQTAMNAPSFDILLSNGAQTNTRDAARAALRRLRASRSMATAS